MAPPTVRDLVQIGKGVLAMHNTTATAATEETIATIAEYAPNIQTFFYLAQLHVEKKISLQNFIDQHIHADDILEAPTLQQCIRVITHYDMLGYTHLDIATQIYTMLYANLRKYTGETPGIDLYYRAFIHIGATMKALGTCDQNPALLYAGIVEAFPLLRSFAEANAEEY